MIKYIRSFSTLLGYFIGTIMYFGYVLSGANCSNKGLIYISIFVGLFLPFYSRMSNKVEEYVNFKTAIVTLGRISRFFLQFIFNLFIFKVLLYYNVVSTLNISDLGGYYGVAAITTIASQGMQYMALILANREIGNKNRNVMFALSINIIITASSAMGITWIKPIFIINGIFFGSIVASIGVLSDIRAMIPAKGGIGIFYGTFNPFHKTHLKIVKKFIKERCLEKVYIHPTVVPKLHLEALEKGEIHISERVNGMRIYERTNKADMHVNYFPTGNKFYEFETRKKFIELVIQNEGLQDKIEVLGLTEEYTKGGFYAITKEIKKRNPRVRIHGLHGSDIGGMWVRNIYDESGIYPYPVRRKDNVSATAIRNGVKGMANNITEEIIENINNGLVNFRVDNYELSFKDYILAEIN